MIRFETFKRELTALGERAIREEQEQLQLRRNEADEKLRDSLAASPVPSSLGGRYTPTRLSASPSPFGGYEASFCSDSEAAETASLSGVDRDEFAMAARAMGFEDTTAMYKALESDAEVATRAPPGMMSVSDSLRKQL